MARGRGFFRVKGVWEYATPRIYFFGLAAPEVIPLGPQVYPRVKFLSVLALAMESQFSSSNDQILVICVYKPQIFCFWSREHEMLAIFLKCAKFNRRISLASVSFSQKLAHLMLPFWKYGQHIPPEILPRTPSLRVLETQGCLTWSVSWNVSK